jgi:hypothetical protein
MKKRGQDRPAAMSLDWLHSQDGGPVITVTHEPDCPWPSGGGCNCDPVFAPLHRSGPTPRGQGRRYGRFPGR